MPGDRTPNDTDENQHDEYGGGAQVLGAARQLMLLVAVAIDGRLNRGVQ